MAMMRIANDEALEEFLKKHPSVKVRSVRLMDAGDKAEPAGRPRLPHSLPRPPKNAKPRSAIEQSMSDQIKGAGLPPVIEWPSQHKPFPDRKFTVDFAWPAGTIPGQPKRKIILEVDGAVHRIKGTFKSSFERGALLMIAGWEVLHVGGDDVRGGAALYWLKELLTGGLDRA